MLHYSRDIETANTVDCSSGSLMTLLDFDHVLVGHCSSNHSLGRNIAHPDSGHSHSPDLVAGTRDFADI